MNKDRTTTTNRKKSLPASTRTMAKILNNKTTYSNTNKSNNNNNNNSGEADTGRICHMSHSTLDYSRCLANPFTGPESGIPTYPSTLSFKQRCWAKGVFSTSATTGFGFITVAPYLFAFSNQLNAIRYSDSTFTGTTITTGLAIGVFGAPSNSTLSSIDVGSGASNLQYRIVSCGLRIRYIGTELNRGGQIIGFMDPTHSTMAGSDINIIDGELTSVRFPVNREWMTVLNRPVVDSELAYSITVPSGGHYISFVVAAASPTVPLQYEFEVYMMAEYQGRNVRGLTPTAHDPIGFAATDYVTQTSKHLLPNSVTNETREGHIVGQVAKYIAHGVSHVTQHHADHVKAIASAASSNSSGGSWYESLWNGIKAIAPVALSVLPGLL